MADSKKAGGSLPILFFLWYAFNVGYNIYNKQFLNIFPHPWTTSFLQVFIGLFYVVPKWLIQGGGPKLSLGQAIKLFPVACLHAGGHLAAVLSMGAGAVSFTHIIKASEPVVSTILGPIFGGSIDPITVNICLIPIVGGVAYAAMKPGQGLDVSDLMTYASKMAMTSNVLFALRGIFSKKIMTDAYKKEFNMDGANTYAVLTIWSAIIIAPLAYIMEGSAPMDSYNGSSDQTTLLKLALFSGLAYYAYNEMGYRVLGQLDAVSTAVGNTIKRVVIMGAAVLLLGESMNQNKLIGASVAIAGTLAYSLAKSNAAGKAKKA